MSHVAAGTHTELDQDQSDSEESARLQSESAIPFRSVHSAVRAVVSCDRQRA